MAAGGGRRGYRFEQAIPVRPSGAPRDRVAFGLIHGPDGGSLFPFVSFLPSVLARRRAVTSAPQLVYSASVAPRPVPGDRRRSNVGLCRRTIKPPRYNIHAASARR
jgi:hypothetical protein